MAETGVLVSSFDNPRNIADSCPGVIIVIDDANMGSQSGERIIGDLGRAFERADKRVDLPALG